MICATMQTHPIMRTLADYFAHTGAPVVCAYLFGSHARGEAKAGSDVDIAVLFEPGTDTGLAGPATRVRGDLERRLGREVDLVDLARAPVDLVHRVLREGHLVAERDRQQRILFEVRARNEYFDLLPHLERYRRGSAA